MVLPEGFALPPWYLLGPLVVSLGVVIAGLWSLDPPVTDRTVLSFTPWMGVGAAIHVLHRFEAVPTAVEPLATTPSVYLLMAVASGGTWAIATVFETSGSGPRAERVLGGAGVGLFAVVGGYTLQAGLATGNLQPFWPVVGIIVTGVLTACSWYVLRTAFPDVTAAAGVTGTIVVFGHALDGVTTAIGYDRLGAHEEVPLSRLILETAETLPTAEFIGSGWLFVLVKVTLAAVVLGLFREYLTEAPRQARLLLAFVAAVGLGPGIHNALLFMVG